MQKCRVLRHAVEAYERRDFEEAANTFSELIDKVEPPDVEVKCVVSVHRVVDLMITFALKREKKESYSQSSTP